MGEILAGSKRRRCLSRDTKYNICTQWRVAYRCSREQQCQRFADWLARGEDLAALVGRGREKTEAMLSMQMTDLFTRAG